MPADIKARLLEAGKDEGCVTLSFLNDLIPEGKDADAIDGIFDFLNENNIEIVSQEKSGKKKTLDGKSWEGSGDGQHDEPPLDDDDDRESSAHT